MVYCQICKKNIAAVHYTEIDVDYKVKKESHMCEGCAQKHGLQGLEAQSMQGVTPKLISPLQVIENLIKPNLPQPLKTLLETKCKTCGMTYPEFRSAGRLGCPNDYKLFKDGIQNILDQVQGGATRHVGKVPKRAGAQIRLQVQQASLRAELEEAIAIENYERAAEIRDSLKQFEQDRSDPVPEPLPEEPPAGTPEPPDQQDSHGQEKQDDGI